MLTSKNNYNNSKSKSNGNSAFYFIPILNIATPTKAKSVPNTPARLMSTPLRIFAKTGS